MSSSKLWECRCICTDVNKKLIHQVVILFIISATCCLCFSSKNDWTANDSLSVTEKKGWKTIEITSRRNRTFTFSLMWTVKLSSTYAWMYTLICITHTHTHMHILNNLFNLARLWVLQHISVCQMFSQFFVHVPTFQHKNTVKLYVIQLSKVHE